MHSNVSMQLNFYNHASQADWLFLLTDVDALYTANPRLDPSAKPIHIVNSLNDLDVDMKGDSAWGIIFITSSFDE